MLRVRDRNFMWLKYVKLILCNCGFNYIWESQTFINELWLKHSIKQNLTDQYLQAWLSSVNEDQKALNYRILYVIQLSDRVYNVTFPAYALYSLRCAEGNIEHKPGMSHYIPCLIAE